MSGGKYEIKIETDDVKWKGARKISIKAATVDQSPFVASIEDYDFEIEMLAAVANTPPEFKDVIDDLAMEINEDFSYKLPEVIDDEGDLVTITVNLGGTDDFLEFDESTNTIQLR